MTIWSLCWVRYPFIQLFSGIHFGHMAWYRSLKSKCMCLIHSLKLFFSHGHLPTSITVCYRPLPFGYHVKQENDPRRFSPAKQIILRMFSVDLRLGGMQAIHRNFWKFTGWKQAGAVPIYLIGNLHEINPSEATMRKSHLSCIITASMEYKEASKLHKVKENQNGGPKTNQTPRHTGVS